MTMDATQACQIVWDILKDSKVFRGICIGRGALPPGIDGPASYLAPHNRHARGALRGLFTEIAWALEQPGEASQGDMLDANPDAFAGNGRGGQIIGVAGRTDLERQNRPLGQVVEAEKEASERSQLEGAPAATGPKEYPQPNEQGVYGSDVIGDVLLTKEVGGRKGKPHASLRLDAIQAAENEWVYRYAVQISPNITTGTPANRNQVFPSADHALLDGLEKAKIEFKNSFEDTTASDARRNASSKMINWIDEELGNVRLRLPQEEPPTEQPAAEAEQHESAEPETTPVEAQDSQAPNGWTKEIAKSYDLGHPWADIDEYPPSLELLRMPVDMDKAQLPSTFPGNLTGAKREKKLRELLASQRSELTRDLEMYEKVRNRDHEFSQQDLEVHYKGDLETAFRAAVASKFCHVTYSRRVIAAIERELGQEAEEPKPAAEKPGEAPPAAVSPIWTAENPDPSTLTFEYEEPTVNVEGEEWEYDFDLPGFTGKYASFLHPAGLQIFAFKQQEEGYAYELTAYCDQAGEDSELKLTSSESYDTLAAAMIAGMEAAQDWFDGIAEGGKVPEQAWKSAGAMSRWIDTQIAGLPKPASATPPEAAAEAEAPPRTRRSKKAPASA